MSIAGGFSRSRDVLVSCGGTTKPLLIKCRTFLYTRYQVPWSCRGRHDGTRLTAAGKFKVPSRGVDRYIHADNVTATFIPLESGPPSVRVNAFLPIRDHPLLVFKAADLRFFLCEMPPPSKPLPLSGTLRDLAVLRASGVDLTPLQNAPSSANSNSIADDPAVSDVETSVAKSYEFVHEARQAMRVMNRGDVEAQGVKVDQARAELEDILTKLGGQTEA